MRRGYRQLLWKQVREGRWRWFFRQGLKYLAVPVGARLGRPLAGPINGSLFVTYRCNNDCLMCGFPQRAREHGREGREELGTQAMLGLVDQFAAAGTTGLGFTGGEPLLRPDLGQLLARSVARGMITNLNTNGFALTAKMAEELLATGLDSINISVDGPTAAIHNRLRGTAQGFERAVAGIGHLLQARAASGSAVAITLVSVISPENLAHLESLLALAAELGVDGIGFMPVHDFQFGKGANLLPGERRELAEQATAALAPLLARAAVARLDNSAEYIRLFPDCFAGQPNPLACYVGYTHLLVDCYGDLYPCWPWLEEKRQAGNLEGTTLAEFWRSAAMNRVRRELDSCHACYWNCHTELNLLFNSKKGRATTPTGRW